MDHIRFETGKLNVLILILGLCDVLYENPNFMTGNLCMITGGRNLGRVGIVTNRERHPGSFDIVHIKDANEHVFATR